ncbi:cytochrome P450 [Aspergillus undulatus]|uniref:cytochrome P450 n=1 Tax=Aspergillus undulatus TaxID=1810928 RepID=UPI003CCCB818
MYAIVFALVLSVLAYGVYHLYLHPLSLVPGPWLTRWTRCWEWYHVRSGSFEDVLIRLHQKHGNIIRIAPNKYSITSPDAIQQIYGHGSKLVKDRFYRAFAHPDESKFDLFSIVNVQGHADRRRKVASLYSMSSLVAYEPAVDGCIELLVERFKGLGGKGESVAVPTWMEYFAFDVVGSLSTGESFGMMRKSGDSEGILDVIHQFLSYSSQMGLFVEWYYWIGGLNHLLGRGIAVNKILNYTVRCLAAHRDGPGTAAAPGANGGAGAHKDQVSASLSTPRPPGTGTAFIELLLKLHKAGKLDYDDIFSTLNGNIVAGADSSALTLSAVVYYLARHPHARETLRREVDEQPEGPISFASCQAMPYLQAVIKETLRLHPATGMILPRVVPSEGATIAGQFFPAKSVVGVNAWTIHRNPEIFGPDADLFRPERWLGPKEEIAPLERNLFTFGAGARTCLGKNISLLEITKLVPMLYRHFDFELEGQWKTWNAFLVLPMFKCKIIPREVGC